MYVGRLFTVNCSNLITPVGILAVSTYNTVSDVTIARINASSCFGLPLARSAKCVNAIRNKNTYVLLPERRKLFVRVSLCINYCNVVRYLTL